MPGKRVHFAKTNSYRSPSPTSSSTLSSASSKKSVFSASSWESAPSVSSWESVSSASSREPRTPPSVAQGFPESSPYGTCFKSAYLLPPQPKCPTILAHPVLSSSPVSFDMRDHPSFGTYLQFPLSSLLLSECAFNYPLGKITISAPRLPWRIDIRASNGRFLTVWDVLDGIYISLRRNIIPTEFNLLSQGDKYRATRAYESRYRRLRFHCACEDERLRGMKRVDFLNGEARFISLSCGAGSDSWVLKHM